MILSHHPTNVSLDQHDLFCVVLTISQQLKSISHLAASFYYTLSPVLSSSPV